MFPLFHFFFVFAFRRFFLYYILFDFSPVGDGESDRLVCPRFCDCGRRPEPGGRRTLVGNTWHRDTILLHIEHNHDPLHLPLILQLTSLGTFPSLVLSRQITNIYLFLFLCQISTSLPVNVTYIYTTISDLCLFDTTFVLYCWSLSS